MCGRVVQRMPLEKLAHPLVAVAHEKELCWLSSRAYIRDRHSLRGHREVAGRTRAPGPGFGFSGPDSNAFPAAIFYPEYRDLVR